MDSNDMVKYLISMREYTIITDNNDDIKIKYLMENNNMNVYYYNLNNLYDKDKILNILKNQYNNELFFDNNLWIFHKGNFIGFKDDIHKIILNYNK